MRTDRDEWRRHGWVPLAAALGYSAAGLQSYGLAPFVSDLEREFGWSRSEVMMGLSITGAFALLFSVPVGMCIDRYGPRKIGLIGLILKCCGFASLATATGSILNWSILWVAISCGVLLVQANVWTSAVASRFDHGRGFAVATALAGTSLTAVVAPLAGQYLSSHYGWRFGLAGVGLTWLIVTLPCVFLFFRGAHEERLTGAALEGNGYTQADLTGVTVGQGLRLKAFWIIAGSNFAFAFYTMSLAPNLVLLLSERGLSSQTAAQFASLVGLVSLVARLSVGLLLDRYSSRLIAVIIFLLPVVGCSIMLLGASSALLLVIAVASFGATIGAEHDVVFYLTSRHLGLKGFAGLLGIMMMGAGCAAIAAPVTAGWIHDRTGGYDMLLILLMVMMAVASAGMATLRSPARIGAEAAQTHS